MGFRISSRSVVAIVGAAVAVTFGCAPAARADSTVFANFEDGMTDGFGTGTNSGVTKNTFTSPTSATVTLPTTGGDTTNVLDLTAPGFNGGISGADLGYDFAANGLTSTFLADDLLTFTWEVPPNTATAGYSQLYNIILNAPGGGYTVVGGSGGTTSPLATTTGTVNQGLYAGFNSPANTVTINYDAYKAAILASTTTPGYIQFEIQTNDGGGAPADIYFDDFTLSTIPTPEPTSAALLGLASAGLFGIRRRRHG